MKLRNKILLYFGSFSLFFIICFLFINYQIVQKTLYRTATKDLEVLVESVYDASESLLETVIRNYLRSAVEQNLLYLDQLNQKVERGTLDLNEAKDMFQDYTSIQQFGESGYIGAIRELKGEIYLEIHPYLRNEDCTGTTVCQEWMQQKNGYNSYEWQNPGEEKVRKKVAYIQYYEPWEWVVGATTYEDELYQLVQIEDLRPLITSFKIRDNGYFFLMDSQYIMRIHPNLEGEYMYDAVNSEGVYIIQELLGKGNDIYSYKWLNPESGREEEKYALMKIIDPFGWYVVATGYISDIEHPVRKQMRISYVLMMTMFLLLIVLILHFSRSLRIPLYHQIEGLNQFYLNRIPYKAQIRAVSEIESVGKAIEEMIFSIIQSEKERQHLVEQLDSVINSMPSMLIGLDKNASIVFLNKKALDFTGVQKEEALNQTIFDFLTDFEKVHSLILEGLESGKTLSAQIALRENSGQDDSQHFDVTVFPLAGTKETAVLRIDDVSERIQMEEMLQHSRKMDAIGQLAGGVAHDFNNMLTGILNAAEILKIQLEGDSSYTPYLEIIENASLRAANLTQQLLTFSRKKHSYFIELDIHQMLKQSVTILRHSVSKKIDIIESYSAENTQIKGDMDQLQSLFMNLGINASHAMSDEGTIHIKTSNTFIKEAIALSENEYLNPGKYVQVEVKDTGHGIPEELQDKIFEPFFTTRDVGQGTGLGLSSAMGVVRQHGGRIRLESKKNLGTRFIIELPL